MVRHEQQEDVDVATWGAAFSWLSSRTVVFLLGGGGGGGSTTGSRRAILEPAASGCGGMYASGAILSALVRHAISRASCQDTLATASTAARSTDADPALKDDLSEGASNTDTCLPFCLCHVLSLRLAGGVSDSAARARRASRASTKAASMLSFESSALVSLEDRGGAALALAVVPGASRGGLASSLTDSSELSVNSGPAGDISSGANLRTMRGGDNI